MCFLLWTDITISGSTWVLVVGVGAILLAFAAYQYVGLVQRRKRFVRRPLVDADEWFRRFYPIAPEHHALVQRILVVIAEELGVHWTQLCPTDTFEEHIRINPCYSPNDDLEETENDLVSLGMELRLRIEELPAFTGTLRQFLDQWRAVCFARRGFFIGQRAVSSTLACSYEDEAK